MNREIFIAILWLIFPLISAADEIFLEDGTRVEVLHAWKENGEVRFKFGNGYVGYPEEDVNKIKKDKIRWGKNPVPLEIVPNERLVIKKNRILNKAETSEYGETQNIKLIKNEDVNNPPINYKRIRTLLVSKGLTKNQLKDLLLRQELVLRQELKAKTAKYKVIFIWAYDDVNRANAGLGEWVGMISNGSGTGKLSNNPKLSIKLKGPEVSAPSSQEDQIYDHLQKELWKDPNVPEEIVMKKVANHFNITVDELMKIFIKVADYRNF